MVMRNWDGFKDSVGMFEFVTIKREFSRIAGIVPIKRLLRHGVIHSFRSVILESEFTAKLIQMQGFIWLPYVVDRNESDILLE